MRLRRGPAYAVLAAAGLVLGWLGRAPFIPDHELFAQSGRAILSGHWHQVYADPAVQAGPLELLFFAFWHALDSALPAALSPSPDTGPGLGLLTVLGTPLIALGGATGIRRLRVSAGVPPSLAAEFVAGALLLAWGLTGDVLSSGHPAEGVGPVLWILAALAARRDQAVTAGVLVGMSAGWETWGVLAAPLLLLSPRISGVVRGGAAALVTLAALYLPFTVAGPFRMFQFHWLIDDASFVHHLLPGADHFSWWMRAVQALLAMGAGAAAAALLQRCDVGSSAQPAWDAVWLVPLVCVVVRLALDPIGYPYYWVPPFLLCLTGVSVRPWPRLASLRTAPWLLLPLAPVAVLFVWQADGFGRTSWGTLLVSLPLSAWLVLSTRWRPRQRSEPGSQTAQPGVHTVHR